MNMTENGTVDSRPAHRARERPRMPALLKDILLLLLKIAAIIAAFALAFTFLYGLHRNTDASMSPAVSDGDLVLFYRLDKTYAPGDALLLEHQGRKQVRRVVATAGDTVDITGDGLMVNGALQQELGIHQQTQRYAEGATFPLTVGEGQVFVLGDARENATDSRIYGAVDVTDTLGKAIAILRQRNI